MTITLDQIKELKTRYVDTLYSQVRTEQKKDQEYITDTFDVSEIKSPHKPIRSGLGRQIVDRASEHIVTANPQAFFETKDKDTGIHLSKEVNKWISLIKLASPNPFKEFTKNLCSRGESYIRLSHNYSWAVNKAAPYDIPVVFLLPDSMVIYGSPEEDDCGWIPNIGIPNRVIVFYSRQAADVIYHYPHWTNPNRKDNIEWLEYWDKDVRYFEADGEPILMGKDEGKDGIQKNIYGLVPFVRKYSGFGKRSPEGKLEDLVISEIRGSRDLLRDECIHRSNISSKSMLFAQSPFVITSPQEFNEKTIREDWELGSNTLLMIPNFPLGSRAEWMPPPALPPEIYPHYQNTLTMLQQRHPFIMAGFPMGASGRQQIETYLAGMARYDTIVENTENAFSTAFELAFEIIKRVPAFPLPKGLRKGDLNNLYKCSVHLRAADLIEQDRLATLGDRLWAQGNGAISLSKFHTQFLGMTQDESETEIDQIMVDKLTLYNPDIAALWGMVAAEEMGMDKFLDMLTQKQSQLQKQQQGLQAMPAPTTQERIQGEAQVPVAPGEMDMLFGSKGMRNPPTRYTRGR